MPNKVNLPEDANSNAVQVLVPDVDNTVVAVTSGTSGRVTLPTRTDIIQITNQQDMWVKFGDNTVVAVAATAGNMLLLAGERAYRVPIGVTDMAYIQDTDAGRLSVTALY